DDAGGRAGNAKDRHTIDYRRLYWIDVASHVQMQTPRAYVADSQTGGFEKLALNIKVPLIDVRRDVRVIVHTHKLRRRRERAGKRIRELRQRDERQSVRRIEIIAGRIRTRVDRIVEYSEPRANRGLMIAEGIVGDSDPGIEVPHRGIGRKDVGHFLVG